MPGLSQLKKFNSDILALGKEAELRASRGEKTSVIPIPTTIEDADDSDDFVLGMPEVAEELSSVDEEEAPDDFSDITGIGKASSQEGTAPADSQKAGVPDVADLLNPVDMSGSGTDSSDVPDLSQFMEPPQEPEPEPEPPSIADLSLDDLLNSSGFDDDSTEEEAPAAEETETEPVHTEPVSAPQKDEPVDSSSFFAEPDVSADTFNEPETLESVEQKPESAALEDIEPEDAADTSPEEIPADEFQEENERAPGDDFDYAGQTLDMNSGLPDEVNETDAGKAVPEPEEPEPVEPLTDDFGIEAVPEPEEGPPAESEDSEQELPAEETFDLPDFDEDAVKEAPSAEVEPEFEEPEGSEIPSSQPEQPAEETVSADAGDLNLPDMGMEGFNPDTFDFNLDDTDIGKSSAVEEVPSGETPPEKFDTSDIAGLDFSIKDTDTKLADDEKSDFELGTDSDFKEENADFEIPGFSDTDTIKEDKNGRIKLPTPDFTGAAEGDKPGKNTLTDKQYKQFLSNLSDYPLNVRIAVENLLVKNEFTDEAQFEVVEKVLTKTPARQVAAHLEKMLDISIPVPRDFERRTAAEYEVYKSSLQYQLRNRIIPGLIFGILALLLVFGLFQAAKNFIYKPLKANKLYKQGYELLQRDEYPQSEMKFNDAVKYELQKKWFYRYARGYRSHKQYQRAEKMYRNILYCFNHDKTAGIEYAQMECDDLENYEKAEAVAKREVLDYHINDSDGILLLGDIYLAWGTEKDPSKLEDARKQYSSLVQLYGPTNVYMSRMMRYFIRTDNLREVLKLKERFYPNEKSLIAQDWTELSGYLLEKLYGQLAPADEYLRTHIEDVKEMLVRAVEADPSNPVAYYNLSRYFVQMNNGSSAIQTLEHTIDTFKKAPSLRRRDTYKEIDSYRLLGEQYTKQKEYLKAQEKYTDGITLFTGEHDSSGLEGNWQVGRLYADAGDIDYFIHGNLDSAYDEYTTAVNTDYATPSLYYRIGYIDYGRGDYDKAVGSFIKVGADIPQDNHLLLAMGNTLSLRNDNYAAQGYYERLISNLDAEKNQKGLLLPQVRADQAELVDLYLKASNNLGVTQYRLARRTGSSSLNAQAMVQLTTSMRAWDAMTRNQTTMVRLGGSNLAEQNMKYMSHSVPEYEPAIYTDIPRILGGEEELSE
jgi:tetratricopeptide (TPR) repeat protein